MDICVAGLGLIGGSMCMALKRAGIGVWGWNRSREPLDYAIQKGIIDAEARDFESFDVVFVAMPPEATMEFINTHKFKDGAIITDICGVKSWVEKRIYRGQRNFRYVGCHPMAGKEVSKIQNACEDLFDNASMVITHCKKTDAQAVETIKYLTKEMGFKRIVECTADVHDRKVAYTSQLAHIVSNAYVKNDEMDSCIGFTGGSFQDMTRIAGVDEEVWASLYLKNTKYLEEDIASIISSLEQIKSAIASGGKTALKKVLREGRQIFEARRDEYVPSSEIKVTELK